MFAIMVTNWTSRNCICYDELERFPPGQRYKTRFLSGDAIANWLWSAQLLRQWRESRVMAPAQPASASR